eukprot:TRINITY_DN31880_c0_g1_i1.p1 TRINITY_DN31880_c0_g1~~TRINITY_DN31880_c0_g1_i1.p1  ORF type:complete len:246 (-),score=27.49 TRINITY_DN31880_c0_g1_i1:319-1056(-)
MDWDADLFAQQLTSSSSQCWGCSSCLSAVPADVIVVLLGGVDEHGVPHPAVRRRLETAAAMHRLWGCAVPILLSGGGTAHKPRHVDAAGWATPEAQLAAAFLVEKLKVEACYLVLESISDDTIGNAWFVRTAHCDPRGWRKLFVITSDFHLPRSQSIFEWVCSLDPISGPKFELCFAGTPSQDLIDPETLCLRVQREAASKEGFEKTRLETTMAQAHCFIFKDHQAYAYRAVPREPVSADLLRTY